MMKKLLFTAFLFAGTLFTNAQETKFGVRAGVDFATAKAKYEVMGTTVEAKSSETGFFAGAFAEIGISESFAIQPEVLYVSIKDFSAISVPILGKYSFGDFSVMAGPDLNYLLDAEEDEFKVNVDFGASYDINESLDVQARYSMGMGDVSLSGIFVGVGYKF